MQNKKINQSLIKIWLKKGKDDLLFAKVALKETEFYSHICYLAQQAVEKYIKAIILLKKGELTKKEKTHNLVYLSQKCKPLADLSDFKKELRVLSQVYIPARYPDETYFKPFSKEEAKECLKMAQKVMNYIENWLKTQK